MTITPPWINGPKHVVNGHKPASGRERRLMKMEETNQTEPACTATESAVPAKPVPTVQPKRRKRGPRRSRRKTRRQAREKSTVRDLELRNTELKQEKLKLQIQVQELEIQRLQSEHEQLTAQDHHHGVPSDNNEPYIPPPSDPASPFGVYVPTPISYPIWIRDFYGNPKRLTTPPNVQIFLERLRGSTNIDWRNPALLVDLQAHRTELETILCHLGHISTKIRSRQYNSPQQRDGYLASIGMILKRNLWSLPSLSEPSPPGEGRESWRGRVVCDKDGEGDTSTMSTRTDN